MVEETKTELDDLLDDVLNEFDSTTTSIKKKSKETLEVNELEDEMSKLVDSLNLQENEKMKENKKKNVYENIQELLHNNNNKEEDFPDLKEDDLNGLIDSMMQQLLSRDVLYEPLKELSLKYPQYINGNDTYRKQYEVTLKLVKIFESNNNEKDGDRVQELLEELQALGPPPVELMDSMVPSSGGSNNDKDSNSQESLDSLLASAQEDMPPECKQM